MALFLTIILLIMHLTGIVILPWWGIILPILISLVLKVLVVVIGIIITLIVAKISCK